MSRPGTFKQDQITKVNLAELSFEQYKGLIETIGAVIWRSAISSFQFTYVSPQAEALFHIPLQQWLEPGFWQNLIYPQDKKWVVETCQRAVERQVDHELEYRIVDGRGKIRWVRDIVRINKLAGEPVEMVGIMLDVSKEHENRQRLEASEEKFSRVFNSCPIPATISRLADSTLLDANDSFVTTSGYNRNELIGSQALALQAWPDPNDRLRIKESLEKDGFVNRLPVTMRDGFGKDRYTLISATIVEIGGENCMLAMFYDITERRKQEKRLRDLNRELEIFMYRASHNLKGPVASIKGLLYLATREVTDEEASRYLKLLQSSANTLENTLEELLDITRLKQGKIKVERIELKDLIEKVCTKLKEQEELQTVQIKYQLHRQDIHSDPVLLYSILHKLLDNALRYRDPSRETLVDISSSFTKDLRLEIKDNGRGIPEAFQEKVFDMFFRASENASGTGLGLYIVKNAVEKLGGEISLKSTVGEGTTFTITLPDLKDKPEALMV